MSSTFLMRSVRVVVLGAVLAMASTAFGTVTVYMADPATGLPTIPVTGTTPFTVNVMLDVGATELLAGLSIQVSTPDASGMLRLTGRTLTHPVLTQPITLDSTILSSTNNLLDPKGKRDLGCITPDGATPTTPGLQSLMTLTFTPQGPLPNPAHIQIVGPGVFANGVWSDLDFADHALPITSITLTPEPASLLLLAVGVAGLTARRRARAMPAAVIAQAAQTHQRDRK